MRLPAISARKRVRDLDLAAMAAQRMNARIERRVGAFRRIGRERAGDQRRLEHALDREQARSSASAVENCVPLSSARPSFGPSTSGVRLARASAASAGMRAPSRKASPTPSIAAVMCASGARSPDAPTEPCFGTTGSTPRSSICCMKASVCGRTPEAPRARLASFSAIISRTFAAPSARRRRPHATARCCAAAGRARPARCARSRAFRSRC